jgi:hypothetical protein
VSAVSILRAIVSARERHAACEAPVTANIGQASPTS